LAMRRYWLQKGALQPIPTRLPQARQSDAESP
jgi:hypothetical protein